MNADDLPESEMRHVEAGMYNLRIKKIEAKDGDKGVYLKIESSIFGGEFKGVTVFDNVSLSNKALWRLKQFLVGIEEGKLDLPIEKGIDDSYTVDEQGVVDAVTEVASGKRFQAELAVEEPSAEGKAKGWRTRNKILSYSPIPNDVPWDE